MALTQISTAGVKDDAVTAGKIPANAVGTSEIAADAVTGAQIADDAINSEHYTDGSIDTAHIADDQVTAAKLADNAVVTAAINADAVTAAKIADDAVGSEHIEQLDADLSFADSAKAKFGAGNDLQVFHDGSNSWITSSTGVLVAGTADFQVANVAGSEQYIRAKENEGVELFFNNSAKLETRDGDVLIKDDLRIQDNNTINVGTGDDLKLYHDGSHSYMDQSGTGHLHIRGNGSDQIKIQAKNGEQSILVSPDSSVVLYYDNAKKFETYGDGAIITGNLEFDNGVYEGDKANGKIQTHQGHMYIQNAGNSSMWIFRRPDGTESANINSSGTYSGSDERRKKDITTISNALSIVKQLTGRSFTWKDDDKKSFGVIAQEVEPVLPDIVSTQSVPEGITDSDPYKMVNYAALSGHFIEAIKELSAEVETLKTKVAAIEAG